METRRGAISAALWAVAVLAIVGGIVGVGWWMRAGGGQPLPPLPPTTQPMVQNDRDYYFFIRLVEFTPKTPKGKPWDKGGNSAPDAKVRLTWRGNRTFSLPKRSDQLIATWDLFRVDVKDLIASGGSADIASMINGPIVHVLPNEFVTLEVWDDDLAFSELALKLDVPLAQLRDGRNDVAVPAGSGLVRLRIDMMDCATPLADLIKWQTGGK